LPEAKVSEAAFWCGFWLLWVAAVVWVVVAFHKTFSLASFEAIYEVRFDARDIMQNSFVNYALMWIYGALNPFLMGYGLFAKRRWLFVIGVLGQVLVYGSYGNKASLLSIVLVLAFYLLFRVRVSFGLALSGSVLFIFALLGILYRTSG